jgi:hypothetical protein
LPILVPAGATAAHRALADKLANAFGEPSSDVCNDNRNKGCCTWVEITDRTTTPGQIYQGYVIVHIAEGAAFISASSERQLELAVDRIIRAARDYQLSDEDKHRQEQAASIGASAPRLPRVTFPVGMMTNYEIVDR